MKKSILLTAILGAACTFALPGNAQMLHFSGANSFSVEGGLSTALNHSNASLIVANNIGAGAPWATTALVSASALNFGLGASLGLQAGFGLNSGQSIYLRSSGNWANGSVDISALFSARGAIPGIHDDGYLILNTWSPVATVTTRTLAVALGLQTAPRNGVHYFAGAIHASVSQDLLVKYGVGTGTPGASSISVNGSATNAMYGAELGATFSRALNDKLNIVLTGELAAMDNSVAYTYQYDNIGALSTTTNTYTAAGRSVVLRSEASVQLVYARSETVSLTGKIGVVNYSNISTGLENTLNPNNTTAAIAPVFGSVIVPYIRAGIRVAF